MAFDDRLERSVREAFDQIDKSFLDIAATKDMPDGTTALLAILWEGDTKRLKMLVAHAGDSRAVLSRGDGSECVRLTEDHKPNRDDEKQWIQARGGIVVEIQGTWRVFTPETVVVRNRVMQWGLAVSRSLGDLRLKVPREVINSKPDVKIYDLNPGEDRCVILGSDGVFDVQTDDEVAGLFAPVMLSPVIRPDVCARKVVRRAYEKLSDDNLTAVVIHILPPDVEAVDANIRKRLLSDDESLASLPKRTRRTL